MPATYRDALHAALLYLLLSVVWLQISDYLLNSFFDSSAERLRWQLINGYAWVLFSAGLILIARARLLRGIGAKLRERDADRMRLRQAAAVFDCTREGVLVTNREGAIVHVNRAFMEITGYACEEVLGQRPNICSSRGAIQRNSIKRCSPRLQAPGSGTGKSGTGAKAARYTRNGRQSA
ncbi:UNVERIFIED_ORG: PAS domain-containing protein [Pseudomonas reinekei]|nr:PAS domain-containing protein [Pseudomonas reinekei]